MNQPEAQFTHPPHPWTWPVELARYDRAPNLSKAECAELKRVMQRKPFHLDPSTKERLHRLLQPIQDVLTVTHPNTTICSETVRVLLIEMDHRDKTFWAWPEQEWLDIIGPSYSAFAQRYGRTYGVGQHPARRELPVLASVISCCATVAPSWKTSLFHSSNW